MKVTPYLFIFMLFYTIGKGVEVMKQIEDHSDSWTISNHSVSDSWYQEEFSSPISFKNLYGSPVGTKQEWPVFGLFSPPLEFVPPEVDYRSDLFYEDNAVDCRDQVHISPAMISGPLDVDEPRFHDRPIYDDYEEAPPVWPNPLVTNSQMITNSPIYDESPSQSDDEMEEDIAINDIDYEAAGQSPGPSENTSLKLPRSLG